MYPPKEEFYYNPPPSAPVTGIPVSVPPGTALNVQPPRIGPWSTGLCGCCDDCGNCCITCLCPCITFGQVAEIVDKGSTSCAASGALYALLLYFTGCACIYSCFYRSKLRAQYGLREAPCNDCLVHCCCECCSLCQMYRELKRRGFDMSLGWQANMDRQVTTPIMAPPPQTMNR